MDTGNSKMKVCAVAAPTTNAVAAPHNAELARVSVASGWQSGATGNDASKTYRHSNAERQTWSAPTRPAAAASTTWLSRRCIAVWHSRWRGVLTQMQADSLTHRVQAVGHQVDHADAPHQAPRAAARLQLPCRRLGGIVRALVRNAGANAALTGVPLPQRREDKHG